MDLPSRQRPEAHSEDKQTVHIQNNIKVLPWPSQSPDLNPMENLWSEIKLRLTLRKDRPKSLDDLFERVQQEWKALPSSYLKSIGFSMPRRIQAVIENHGGHIKY